MVGNTIGVPPEVMGLVVVCPFLSAVNMVHVADKKKHYLLEVVTGIFSNVIPNKIGFVFIFRGPAY